MNREERHKVSPVCGCTKAAVAVHPRPSLFMIISPGAVGCLPKNYLQDFKGQYLQTDGL